MIHWKEPQTMEQAKANLDIAIELALMSMPRVWFIRECWRAFKAWRGIRCSISDRVIQAMVCEARRP